MSKLNEVVAQEIVAQAAAKKAAKKVAKAAAPKTEKVKLFDNGTLKSEDLKEVVADLGKVAARLQKSGLHRSSERIASLAVALETRHGSTNKKVEAAEKKIAKLVDQLRKLAPADQLDKILAAAKKQAEEAVAAK